MWKIVLQTSYSYLLRSTLFVAAMHTYIQNFMSYLLRSTFFVAAIHTYIQNLIENEYKYNVDAL